MIPTSAAVYQSYYFCNSDCGQEATFWGKHLDKAYFLNQSKSSSSGPFRLPTSHPHSLLLCIASPFLLMTTFWATQVLHPKTEIAFLIEHYHLICCAVWRARASVCVLRYFIFAGYKGQEEVSIKTLDQFLNGLENIGWEGSLVICFI